MLTSVLSSILLHGIALISAIVINIYPLTLDLFHFYFKIASRNSPSASFILPYNLLTGFKTNTMVSFTQVQCLNCGTVDDVISMGGEGEASWCSQVRPIPAGYSVSLDDTDDSDVVWVHSTNSPAHESRKNAPAATACRRRAARCVAV